MYYLTDGGFFAILRKYLEKGHVEDWIQLRLYFERREILSHWLKDNLWLVSLIGDSAIQSLRPPLCAAEVPVPMLNGDPVACLVQRYLSCFFFVKFVSNQLKILQEQGALKYLDL